MLPAVPEAADGEPPSTRPLPNDQASGVVDRFNPSSTAVIIIFLLFALFFLGFFSIFARLCFSTHSTTTSGRRRRRRRRRRLPTPLLLRGEVPSFSGLDQTTISRLPVLSYTAGGSASGCVVCLCEFEEKESMKVIPACGHVFHPGCIDAWLVSRGTCPVCRCRDLFGSDVCLSLFGDDGGCGDHEVGVVLGRSRSWCVREEDGDNRGVLRRTYSA